jgi:hypothetical protein
MLFDQESRWCDGCGVEITWGPVVEGNWIYCCEDCREGRVCRCGERMELEEEYREASRSVDATWGYG